MESSSLRHSGGVEHRRLAGFHHVLRAAHGRSRVCRHNLAGDQPIEQHAHGGELLLYARRRMGPLERLYIGGDIERPDRGQRQPAIFAPGEELSTRPRISSARIWIADVSGEEFDIAPGGRLAGVGDQRRHQIAVDWSCERAGLAGAGSCDITAPLHRREFPPHSQAVLAGRCREPSWHENIEFCEPIRPLNGSASIAVAALIECGSSHSLTVCRESRDGLPGGAYEFWARSRSRSMADFGGW